MEEPTPDRHFDNTDWDSIVGDLEKATSVLLECECDDLEAMNPLMESRLLAIRRLNAALRENSQPVPERYTERIRTSFTNGSKIAARLVVARTALRDGLSKTVENSRFLHALVDQSSKPTHQLDCKA